MKILSKITVKKICGEGEFIGSLGAKDET
jgi:hypothetical protein